MNKITPHCIYRVLKLAFKEGCSGASYKRWRAILILNISTNIMISNASAKSKARARLRN